ncbi:MAG: LPXTG cell wall anchor domain-containing protein [Oscillospiraceae bacterium]|nr:LPXTG cell wall anchor domain-containing protein [Oscillospiraceae bacterium]MBQ8918278.1 LPXTG cell wall anchor domain-containing protein [Oscillospiraceae bacterium]MBQ9109688.1 LPXTG cell wall anchor domain-containing protein [Oscillospiraceae bacterium]
MKLIRKTMALVGAAALMTTQAFAAAVNPSTGDNSILVPMLIVGGIALVAIVAFFLTGKKK